MLPTSTFEKSIILKDKKSITKLEEILSDETKASPFSVKPYTQTDREKAEILVQNLVDRSK